MLEAFLMAFGISVSFFQVGREVSGCICVSGLMYSRVDFEGNLQYT